LQPCTFHLAIFQNLNKRIEYLHGITEEKDECSDRGVETPEFLSFWATEGKDLGKPPNGSTASKYFEDDLGGVNLDETDPLVFGDDDDGIGVLDRNDVVLHLEKVAKEHDESHGQCVEAPELLSYGIAKSQNFGEPPAYAFIGGGGYKQERQKSTLLASFHSERCIKSILTG